MSSKNFRLQKTEVATANLGKWLIAVLIFTIAVFACACSTTPISNTDTAKPTGIEHHDGYTLEQSTIFARHHLRAPMSLQTINSLTNNSWIDWGAKEAELTEKGKTEEAYLGQYFKEYYENEGLLAQNNQPTGNQVYFLSNSKQRTVETANAFLSSLVPNSNIKVNYGPVYDQDDPEFGYTLTNLTEQEKQQINSEADKLDGCSSIDEFIAKQDPNIKIINDTLNIKDSKYAQAKHVEALDVNGSKLVLEEGKRPSLSGNYNVAYLASEALLIQYYEAESDAQASFGKALPAQQWNQISEFGDSFLRLCYALPTTGKNVSKPTMKLLYQQLNATDRKISFLCGHDANIYTMLSAMDVCDYTLPNSLQKVPFGSNLVINKYTKGGEEFASVSLVYETTDQIRQSKSLNMQTPPMEYKLEFKGLQRNEDGLYKYSDLINRIASLI